MSYATWDTACQDHGKSGKPEGYHKINRRGFFFLHREVYADANGLLAIDLAGKVVRHTCDNPRCINPSHLVIGSWADNNRDRAERGRSAKRRDCQRVLSDADAAYIRDNIKVGSRGEFSANSLARRFGVDRKTLYLLRKGKTYFDKVPT